MNESESLVPIEQKEVLFYEDTIVAVRLANSSIFVPVKPICELLGVDWGGQYRRIQRAPVLAEAIRPVDVTSTRRGHKLATPPGNPFRGDTFPTVHAADLTILMRRLRQPVLRNGVNLNPHFYGVVHE